MRSFNFTYRLVDIFDDKIIYDQRHQKVPNGQYYLYKNPGYKTFSHQLLIFSDNPDYVDLDPYTNNIGVKLNDLIYEFPKETKLGAIRTMIERSIANLVGLVNQYSNDEDLVEPGIYDAIIPSHKVYRYGKILTMELSKKSPSFHFIGSRLDPQYYEIEKDRHLERRYKSNLNEYKPHSYQGTEIKIDFLATKHPVEDRITSPLSYNEIKKKIENQRNKKTRNHLLKLHLLIRLRYLQELSLQVDHGYQVIQDFHEPPPIKLEKGHCIISGKDIDPPAIMHEEHFDQDIVNIVEQIQQQNPEFDIYTIPKTIDDEEDKHFHEEQIQDDHSYNGFLSEPESRERMKEYSTSSKFSYFDISHLSQRRRHEVMGRTMGIIEALQRGSPLYEDTAITSQN